MEGTIATIVGFAGNFAPRTWAYCAGQLLSINSNTALFSLIGTIYGGDGRTTFGLPDLRGRVGVSSGGGNGPGLSDYRLGQRSGQEYVYLTINQIPSHNHTVEPGYADTAGQQSPVNAYPASLGQPVYGASRSGNMGPATVGNTGGSQEHNNLQPYLAINWIICQQGIFPSRG